MNIDLKKLGDDLVEWMMMPENILVFEYFSSEKISKKRVEGYAKDDEYFRDCLEIAGTIQEVKVAKGAMGGHIKTDVALRLLGSFHGWKETTKVEVNVPPFTSLMEEFRKSDDDTDLYIKRITTTSGGVKDVKESSRVKDFSMIINEGERKVDEYNKKRAGRARKMS